MPRSKLPRDTVIKFDVFCICVERPEAFLASLKKMCDFYSVKDPEPLIKWRTEEGKIIRKDKYEKTKKQ